MDQFKKLSSVIQEFEVIAHYLPLLQALPVFSSPSNKAEYHLRPRRQVKR